MGSATTQAVRIDPAFAVISKQVIERARRVESAADADQLEALWALAMDELRVRLLLDEDLRGATLEFQASLVELRRAGSARALRSAADDLRHHAAMLEDLLASPFPLQGC